MNTFVKELRVAHAVFTAHASGADDVAEISRRTGLSLPVCSEWAKLLKLKRQRNVSAAEHERRKQMQELM